MKRELSNETLMKIDGVISTKLYGFEAGPPACEAGSQWTLDNLD